MAGYAGHSDARAKYEGLSSTPPTVAPLTLLQRMGESVSRLNSAIDRISGVVGRAGCNDPVNEIHKGPSPERMNNLESVAQDLDERSGKLIRLAEQLERIA